MSVRKFFVVATALAAFAVPSAHADEGLGVNTQAAGDVVSASEGLIGGGASDVGAQNVAGQCTYYGETNVAGGWDYQFGGEDAATSTSQSLPELTDIVCTLTSPAQGLPGERGTLTATCEIALAGPASVCQDTTSAKAWPARPVIVCIDGYAIYGPTPVIRKDVVHACKTSTL